MKRLYIFILSLLCLLLGILSFAITHEWIIFYCPTAKDMAQPSIQQHTKKTIHISFWYRNNWQQEQVELIWPEETSQQLKQVIHKWLHILDEEHITKRRITLQSAMVSDNGYAYLSFDRNPIIKSQSTYHNLMWFEGLLKTIRESSIEIKGIYFMAHHQPLNDMHLDFSHPWPLTGFSKQ